MTSKSRYLPKCECVERQFDAFEYKTISVAAQAALTAMMLRVQSTMCVESESYVAITMIATAVAGLACDPTGRNPGVVEPERLEQVLSTLVEDVRVRIEELEMMKRQAAGRTN